MKEIFDKVLFAVLATMILTYLLYSYNIYAKAFETAQTQSNVFSLIAVSLKSIILDDLTALLAVIRDDALSGPDALSTKKKDDLLKYAGIIELRSRALGDKLPDASNVGKIIAEKLRDAVPQLITKAGFKPDRVEAFIQDVETQQIGFLTAYSKKIGSVQSEELEDFRKAFDANVPLEARPSTVLIIAVLTLGFYLVYLKIFTKSETDFS